MIKKIITGSGWMGKHTVILDRMLRTDFQHEMTLTFKLRLKIKVETVL